MAMIMFSVTSRVPFVEGFILSSQFWAILIEIFGFIRKPSKSPNAVESSHFGTLYCEFYQLEEKTKIHLLGIIDPDHQEERKICCPIKGPGKMFETAVLYWYAS